MVTINAFGPRIDILVNIAGGMWRAKHRAEMDARFLEDVMPSISPPRS
ncbi:MAG: hypothetical protein R3C16_02325 [Hyphomonadaceae bacterium]